MNLATTLLNSVATQGSTFRSLRFRSGAAAYLNRTPGSGSNRQTFTWSGWVKGYFGDARVNGLFGAGNGNSGGTQNANFLFYQGTLQLGAGVYGVSTDCYMASSSVYRDPSAWYHVVLSVDTTQAVDANRVKLYINNQQITAFSSLQYPTQNYSFPFNNTVPHRIGNTTSGASIGAEVLDGYMTNVYFVDGQQLTPSAFGRTNQQTGVWEPSYFQGTFGTNGFYLPFTNNSSTTTLGYDYSGNSNNWTTNNFSLTAGATYDSMPDVPTLTSPDAANYCVMNPLEHSSAGFTSIGDGNLTLVVGGYNWPAICGTLAVPPTGKWYYEFTGSGWTTASNWPNVFCGFFKTSVRLTPDPSDVPNTSICGIYIRNDSNQIRFYDFLNNPFSTSPTLSAADGDSGTYMIAVDFDNNKMYLGYNGTWYQSGNPSAGTNGLTITNPGEYVRPMFMMNTSAGGQLTTTFNFGQQAFAYAIPTGYKTLNTYNLPDSAVVQGNRVMDATLYTGNGSAVTVTNTAGFKPDLVWGKSRSNVLNHCLIDSVRGVSKSLFTDVTDPEVSAGGYYVTGFNSNGFDVGLGTGLNTNGATYVGWQWQAGQGTTSSNASGSITSTVSVNTTAGFSIVTYTGTGSGAQTIGHGLGTAPNFMVVKDRTNTAFWVVYHASLGNTQFLRFNTTDAAAANINAWNNTSPTSSVFTIKDFENGAGDEYVAYCWAPVAGFSNFGSYTGNGSTDGPFVYTGFRPKYVMTKGTAASRGWNIQDTTRGTYNAITSIIETQSSDAEATNSGYAIDILSNGFKIRNANTYWNGDTETYIYMAFAENPFKNALAR